MENIPHQAYNGGFAIRVYALCEALLRTPVAATPVRAYLMGLP